MSKPGENVTLYNLDLLAGDAPIFGAARWCFSRLPRRTRVVLESTIVELEYNSAVPLWRYAVSSLVVTTWWRRRYPDRDYPDPRIMMRCGMPPHYATAAAFLCCMPRAWFGDPSSINFWRQYTKPWRAQLCEILRAARARSKKRK